MAAFPSVGTALAETVIDVTGLGRSEAYAALEAHLASLLEGETDALARASTFVCLVHHALGNLWTGFYRRTGPATLKVGPYQGTPGCLEIAFGRGVCGTAAAEGRTVVVPDVHAFPGHIACDARSRSEIVVPVFGEGGELVAVLDLDSERPGAFDEVDARGLERLLRRFIRRIC
jgi:L-methionine (R)-S-oxide reductase